MRLSTSLAIAALLALPACQSMPAFSPSAAPTDVTTWRHAVAHIRPPSAGCFTASVPSMEWTPIACSTAPTLRSHRIGNGNDYFANVGPHVISVAEGSFLRVAGLRSVRSQRSGKGWSGLNAYSLQLNTQFFATSSCARIAHCAGWVQFVYQNPPNGAGSLQIWDWLVSTTSANLSGCPPRRGWQYSFGDCVQTSPKSVSVPNQPITGLPEMNIVGQAASDGDSITFGTGGTQYAIRNAQSDDVADLSAHWQGAEFNVFAPGNGATATFNAGTTINVNLEMQDGSLDAPACSGDAGTTAESNSLSFVKAPVSTHLPAYPS